MAIERIIIGSKNPAKVDEWRKLLGDLVEIKSVADIGDFPEPIETGKTFAENARLKAKYYADLVHDPVLADDGGFEIDALGGLPGVKSRRVLPGDKEGTDQECADWVLEKMKDIPKEKRTARLTAHVAISDEDGNIIFEDAADRDGFITEKLEAPIITGFPYRSLLFIPEAGKVYAQLSEEEHEKLNHRKVIAERVKKFLLL